MRYLKDINKPEDIKRLDRKQLEELANEIRDFIINSVSKTGGHLASNLGVVELTLAIHYCFDSPTDKIIWDVGHQAYIHKILTGRKDKFNTLRKFNGLSGFPKSSESEHDAFETGHSSTSISAALGYAMSRDIKGEKNSVVSVIGDGSMTSGLAYEGLNNAGRSNTNIIVILNDNQMSISENVGALNKHLSDMRSAPIYIEAKQDVSNFLKKVPYVGKPIGKMIEKTKDGIKYLLVPGILFEELGFKYIGPLDGHDTTELIKVMNQAKKMSGPILLHVITKKGKGYTKAEKYPENFHGVGAFDVKTGKVLKLKDRDTYSDVFGKTILDIATTNKKIVAITAAMPSGTGLLPFQKAFPDRIFDVGIAESHAVTFAAGMAKNDFIPVFAVYSTFLQRGYDQILHDVCIQNLHVIFAIDRAGIVGDDGETHQGIFDLSYLSSMPNMTILAPKNKYELVKMLNFAVGLKSPVAIRYPRGEASSVCKYVENQIEYAKSELIEKGKDVCIISVGSMMDISLKVSNNLKEKGIIPTLINARFVKPIDKEMIESLNDYKNVFIIEDNVKHGGYYSLVVEYLNELNKKSCSVYSFSFGDMFIEQGSVSELQNKYGLDEKSITDKIISIVL